jgi:predicted Fe-Mo cluster-binding NifX family protein
MKIAISSDGKSLTSNIDQMFGRCKYFAIIEIDEKMSKNVEFVENKGAVQGHGAGTEAGQQLGNLGVEIVITGSLGPNAANVLKELGIKSLHASGKVEDAIKKFINNELEEIEEISKPHSTEQKVRKKESEKIFFPLLDDNGLNSEISEHFGHAPFFGVYDVAKKELKIVKNKLDHADPAKSPIDQIEEAVHPTTIFAKGIGGRAIGIIAEKGLSLKTGPFGTVREAVVNLDELEDLTESCGHKH